MREQGGQPNPDTAERPAEGDGLFPWALAEERRRTLRLLRGRYIIRHRCVGRAPLPEARIMPVARGRQPAPVLLGPASTCASAVLRTPGQSAVIEVAARAGTVDLCLTIPRGFPPDAVHFALERLSPVHAPCPLLTGHQEGVGDLCARADGWLGDPGAGRRLEGVRLADAAALRDADIRLEAEIAGRGRAGPAGAGVFLGTRGEARALTGIALRMAGAPEGAVAVEAVFTRAGRRTAGPGVWLRGAVAEDPLLALRLRLPGDLDGTRSVPLQENPGTPRGRTVRRFTRETTDQQSTDWGLHGI